MTDLEKFKDFLDSFGIEYDIETEREMLTKIYDSEDQSRSLEEYFEFELECRGEKLSKKLNCIWLNACFDTYPKTVVSFYFDHEGKYKDTH